MEVCFLLFIISDVYGDCGEWYGENAAIYYKIPGIVPERVLIRLYRKKYTLLSIGRKIMEYMKLYKKYQKLLELL